MLMETGKDYCNMPDSYKENNPLVQSLNASGHLSRANTVPDLGRPEDAQRRAATSMGDRDG